MKTRIVQTHSSFQGGEIEFFVQMLHDGKARSNVFRLNDPDNRQLAEPVRAVGYYERESGNPEADDGLVFMFRNRVVAVEPPYEVSSGEIILTVMHVVFSQEQIFLDMRSDIERFERLKDAGRSPREPIPPDVRAFVWRRDEGRCVRCGGNEKLEFDHVIALANGGSNTERNIQLLCETCNRSKGASI